VPFGRFKGLGAILPLRCLWQRKRGGIGSVSQSSATKKEQCDNETSGKSNPPTLLLLLAHKSRYILHKLFTN
ncbi:MAG TPA: hypothetical protein DCO93_00255, partial [Clostridiales bacterium]|nr:hypothetical protein [Clostridiales bacterium]